jgi:hypothetical protein
MLLGTVVYLFVVSSVLHDDSHGYFLVGPLLLTTIVWNAIVLIVTILVIIDSVRKVRKGMTAQLATGVFVVKLAAIPFFLINFALMAVLAYTGMLILVVGGVALLTAVGISVVLTYLTMLSTSVYGWANVVQLRRERRIDTGMAVIYTFLLFIFVADTVAGILLFVHYRRAEKVIAAAQGASIES